MIILLYTSITLHHSMASVQAVICMIMLLLAAAMQPAHMRNSAATTAAVLLVDMYREVYCKVHQYMFSSCVQL
jgi:hypothetical protein